MTAIVIGNKTKETLGLMAFECHEHETCVIKLAAVAPLFDDSKPQPEAATNEAIKAFHARVDATAAALEESYRMGFRAGRAIEAAGYSIVRNGPDPLGEALNSGDGSYRP